MLKLIFLFIGIINFSFQIEPKDDKILNFIQESFDIITVDELYKNFENKYITKKDCENTITALKSIIKERYIYLDILKNPPKPFEKIDLLSLLDTVCVNESNPNSDILIFSMLQKMVEVLSKPQDEHLYIEVNRKNTLFSILDESKAISPYKIDFSEDGKAHAIPSRHIALFAQEIQEAINNYHKTEVLKINGKTPIEYIKTFNYKYNRLKSAQAQFVQNQIDMEEFYITSYPFDSSFQNVKIDYTNGKSINVNYLILKPKINQSALYKEFKQKNYYKSKGNLRNNRNLYDLSEQFLIEKNFLEQEGEVIWDKYTLKKEIKCKIDTKNEINVISQKSFYILDNNYEIDYLSAMNVLDECFQLFDNNTYKIVVIEDYNKGGLMMLATYFTEYLNLKRTNYVYSAFKSNLDMNYIEEGLGRDIKTCEFNYLKNFKSQNIEINYGKNSDGVEIKHNISQLFDYSSITD